MRGVIKHSGRVVEVHKDYVRVSIMAQSACASCHAKDVCGSNDQKEKFVDIHNVSESYAIDEVVEVLLTTHNGSMAVVLAYFMPFIVMMIVLLLLLDRGYGELFSALLSLGAVAIYYIGLYLSRHKIEKKIHFAIRKINLT